MSLKIKKRPSPDARGAKSARYHPASPEKRASMPTNIGGAGNGASRRALAEGPLACDAQEPCSRLSSPPVFSCPGSLQVRRRRYSLLHRFSGDYYSHGTGKCQAARVKIAGRTPECARLSRKIRGLKSSPFARKFIRLQRMRSPWSGMPAAVPLSSAGAARAVRAAVPA